MFEKSSHSKFKFRSYLFVTLVAVTCFWRLYTYIYSVQLICADTLKFQVLEGPPEGHPRVKHITDEYLARLANYIGVKVMLLTFIDS